MKTVRRKKHLSAFTLLSKSFNLYKKIWYLSFPFALLISFFWKSWRIWGVPQLSRKLDIDLQSPAFTVNNYLKETGIILLVTFLLALILAGLTQAYLALICHKHQQGIRVDFTKLLSYLSHHLLPLSFVIALLYFFLDVGFLILIVPGLLLGYFFQFAILSVVIENENGFDAFRKSFMMVRHNFTYLLTSSLMIWLAIYALHYLTRKMLVTSIAYQSLILPFFWVYFYLLYRELTSKI